MKNKNPFCGKCGLTKTLNAAQQLICRECMRICAGKHGAYAEAWASRQAADRAANAAAHQGLTALDWFDAMCDLHDIGMTVPQMHPNAGRLKAGQSLYPRREVTV